MTPPGRRHLGPVGFTIVLVLLVTFAITEPHEWVFKGTLIAAVLASVAVLLLAFPGSAFFVIGFANWLGVYACVFMFFRSTNFHLASTPWVEVAFILPIATFLGAALWRREDIRAIVTARGLREGRRFTRLMDWLAPVGAIGASTFLLGEMDLDRSWIDVTLVLAMAAIAVVVAWVSHDVTTFLLDVGVLFEEFFERIRLMVMPAFAFLTFYSMVVIVFASIYRVLDRVTVDPLFLVDGHARRISFAESLYFSIVTLSTVGYGDILPRSHLVWVLVSIEIVCGVLLLLFGFSEIMSHARERREHRDQGR